MFGVFIRVWLHRAVCGLDARHPAAVSSRKDQRCFRRQHAMIYRKRSDDFSPGNVGERNAERRDVPVLPVLRVVAEPAEMLAAQNVARPEPGFVGHRKPPRPYAPRGPVRQAPPRGSGRCSQHFHAQATSKLRGLVNGRASTNPTDQPASPVRRCPFRPARPGFQSRQTDARPGRRTSQRSNSPSPHPASKTRFRHQPGDHVTNAREETARNYKPDHGIGIRVLLLPPHPVSPRPPVCSPGRRRAGEKTWRMYCNGMKRQPCSVPSIFFFISYPHS